MLRSERGRWKAAPGPSVSRQPPPVPADASGSVPRKRISSALTIPGTSSCGLWPTSRTTDGFLSEAGITYGEGDRRRFLRKVVDWIESTPDRHNLVMRVSALRGHLEPYPSYVQVSEPSDRDSLAQ